MRVHLKNIVQSAIEKGVAVGYHRASKLPARKRKDTDAVINIILTSIWQSLDGIIDFTDDDTEPSDKKPRVIGFGVDAIGDVTINVDDNNDKEEDNANAHVPLNILYRIHNHSHRRKL